MQKQQKEQKEFSITIEITGTTKALRIF